MNYAEKSLTEFTGLLASNAPAPGGGGASALAAAVGVSLGDMVGELTIGKKKYADVEGEIKSLIDQAQNLRIRLLSCIDADAECFEPLSKAYAIPKETPGRETIMEEALKKAVTVPYEIVKLSCEAINIIEEFGRLGSVLAISDAATGAAITKGALYGAAVNVFVNTSLMKDRDFAEKIDTDVKSRMSDYGRKADEIFESVVSRF